MNTQSLEIRIKQGQLILLGASFAKLPRIDDFYRVLGKEDRRDHLANTILTYDELGIFLHVSELGFVEALNLCFAEEMNDFYPARKFEGIFEIEGKTVQCVRDMETFFGDAVLDEWESEGSAKIQLRGFSCAIYSDPDSHELLDVSIWSDDQGEKQKEKAHPLPSLALDPARGKIVFANRDIFGPNTTLPACLRSLERANCPYTKIDEDFVKFRGSFFGVPCELRFEFEEMALKGVSWEMVRPEGEFPTPTECQFEQEAMERRICSQLDIQLRDGKAEYAWGEIECVCSGVDLLVSSTLRYTRRTILNRLRNLMYALARSTADNL